MNTVSRNKHTGNFWVRHVKSCWHAISGLIYATIKEHNMYIILLAVVVTTGAGLYYSIKPYEWLFCIMAYGVVGAAEMINTSIEATVDLVTLEKHPLAKIAKDTASSATFILSITSLIGALVIFIPYMF